MSKPSEAMICAAADWWTRAIENPRFDNGDDSAQGGMAIALAVLGNKPKAAVTLEKFRESFVARLKADFEANRAPRIISVDYGPDSWLQEVAELAGCGTGITDWPWKTIMRLNDGRVEVSAGYCAEYKTIFPLSEIGGDT